MELNRTYNEDCVEGMQRIPSDSVDMILTDLPYGRTNNKWDIKLDLQELFKQYKRVIKKNGCIALFADGMLIKELMTEGADIWRYNLVWDKGLVSNFLNANRQPLRQHEEIIIFYKRQPTYNPQFTIGKPLHSMGSSFREKRNANNNYRKYASENNPTAERTGDTRKYPTSIIRINRKASCKMIHPTEKPVEVMENLILTYTNEGETVLDSCSGSGTTQEACIRTGRKYIAFEKDAKIFKQSIMRLEGVIKNG